MVRKKAKERPDPKPYTMPGLLIMPERLTASSSRLFHWRQLLKAYLLSDRDFECRGCGGDLQDGAHMHEGIFSRGKVEGWPKRWRILIHCELNCVLLCAQCNMGVPPQPLTIWKEHCDRYGATTMLEWFDSLPFKQTPAFVNQTRQMLAYIEARKEL